MWLVGGPVRDLITYWIDELGRWDVAALHCSCQQLYRQQHIHSFAVCDAVLVVVVVVVAAAV